MTLRDIYLYREYPIIENQELISSEAITEYFLQMYYKINNFDNLEKEELDEEVEELKNECKLIGFIRMYKLCECYLKIEDEDLKEEIIELFYECYEDMKDDESFSDLF